MLRLFSNAHRKAGFRIRESNLNQVRGTDLLLLGNTVLELESRPTRKPIYGSLTAFPGLSRLIQQLPSRYLLSFGRVVYPEYNGNNDPPNFTQGSP